MIKGCQKKVIWLRNTENDLFEEAYFILSETAYREKKSEGDMVQAARRLINESPVCNYWGTTERSQGGAAANGALYGGNLYGSRSAKSRTAFSKGVCFLLGCIVGALPALIFLLTKL